VGSLPPILNYLRAGSGPGSSFAPIFHSTLLTDSLTLDRHPIFTAAIEQAEKLLIIRKDWTANPPAWPDNQGVNHMLPNDDYLLVLLYINEEEVN